MEKSRRPKGARPRRVERLTEVAPAQVPVAAAAETERVTMYVMDPRTRTENVGGGGDARRKAAEVVGADFRPHPLLTNPQQEADRRSLAAAPHPSSAVPVRTPEVVKKRFHPLEGESSFSATAGNFSGVYGGSGRPWEGVSGAPQPNPAAESSTYEPVGLAARYMAGGAGDDLTYMEVGSSSEFSRSLSPRQEPTSQRRPVENFGNYGGYPQPQRDQGYSSATQTGNFILDEGQKAFEEGRMALVDAANEFAMYQNEVFEGDLLHGGMAPYGAFAGNIGAYGQALYGEAFTHIPPAPFYGAPGEVMFLGDNFGHAYFNPAAEFVDDFAGGQQHFGDLQAHVDASLARLDSSAQAKGSDLDHVEETQVHVDHLAQALGDNIRSHIDSTLARIEDTRQKFNEQRKPFGSVGGLPGSASSSMVPPEVVSTRVSATFGLNDPGGRVPQGGRPVQTRLYELQQRGDRPPVLHFPRPPPLPTTDEDHRLRLPTADAFRRTSDGGAARGDEEGAPLARQETMVESVREYDDISVTTLVDMDTTTPTLLRAKLASWRSRSSRISRVSKVSSSRASRKSRASVVSILSSGEGGNGGACTTTSLTLDAAAGAGAADTTTTTTVTGTSSATPGTIPYSPDDDSAAGGSEGDGVSGGGAGAGLDQHRVVYINEPQPFKYCTNAICTAKYRYKLLFFLPMFLFEQFRRYANIFFLIIALLQQIPGVSPTGRYTTLVPLICILVVSAIKEIAEDIKRHRADDEINKREIEVLREGQWQWVKWRNLQVGDIVKVRNNKFFPADLILLSSSEPQGLCYVETANLDGETNLKIRQGLPQTTHILEGKDLMNLSGRMECELPNRFLYQFTGNFKETSRPHLPLSPDQILLRGAKLQNTNWIFGIVIYTGHETKLMKNSATSAPLKRSTVDKLTNHLIILLFFLLIVLCLIMAICNSQWNASLHWYLSLDGELSGFIRDQVNSIFQATNNSQTDLSMFNFGINFITFIILFNNLIPISLQVSLEVVRFIQAGFINNDYNMHYEEQDIWAMARTSNLNEELGMVKYVMSDKTGTLTCNIMEFKRCTIGGTVYTMADESIQELMTMLDSDAPGATNTRQFLTMLAVCHTVIPDRDEKEGDRIIYHAASPDERALVEGARQLNFTFETRTPDAAIIDANGQKEKYEILNVLEFTSARKRMSVIVRTPEGQIKLYCKGADTVIYERLSDTQQFHNVTLRHLEEFAAEGLRTLCYAVADISSDFYEEWKGAYYKASTALQFRERKLEDAAQLIENNLTLLGATAIEDKLQDQVPETIAALLKAGIHVWVLTGDKQETAINIGHSCHLLNQGMPLIILNTDSLDDTRDAINRHIAEFGEQLKKENEAALIVDGKTLIYALTTDLRKDFLDLCISCKSVICCRVSPSQKAEVVELLTQETGAVTLAIGDGANDVAMIQKANVGVGIAGLEGLQAACASDYAIGQFRFLARLLFVHGAWNYSRLCKVILYSFYKNICLYVIELWWAVVSGWSGQVLFERWSIAMYNVLFTAAPPLVLGIFDRSCSAETRMKYPELYRESQSGSHYNWKVFVWWVFLALVHSLLLFILPSLSMTQDIAWGHGRSGGYLMLGNMVYTYVVVTVCLKAGLETDAWTWVTHLAIWGSIASWFVFLLVYSNFWPFLPMAPDMCGIYIQVYSSPLFWFGLILVPFTSLILDISVKIIENTALKSLTEQVRESEISNKDVSKVLDTKQRLTETARLLKNVFRRTTTRVNLEVELAHGFAFSQEEHGVVRQSEVIRAYDTTQPKPGGM
ncbi:ATPase phospholipid transporting 8A1 isoform X2 [Oratosquilla oratoria]|uniref:ATPase phospholipid transporting 8A1 isoform X2 n=1 Tax=Oratosquilla oratoria TaxID=337810 RepID=UPI003F7637A3